MAASAAAAAPIQHAFKTNHVAFTTLRARVLVAGDQCVGKTALIRMLTSKGTEFSKAYVMTTTYEVTSHVVTATDADRPTRVELLLLDAPGAPMFHHDATASKLWATANMIAAVFDLGNHDSFQSVGRWLRKMVDERLAADPHARPPIAVIVGAKSDFRDASIERAVVTETEARALADSLGVGYFEVSAERGADVEKPFQHLADKFYATYAAESRRIEALA